MDENKSWKGGQTSNRASEKTGPKDIIEKVQIRDGPGGPEPPAVARICSGWWRTVESRGRCAGTTTKEKKGLGSAVDPEKELHNIEHNVQAAMWDFRGKGVNNIGDKYYEYRNK